MKTICYYHRDDLDGVGSAAIVKKSIPEAELYPVTYSDKPDLELIKDNKVIIVDFSFKEMKEIVALAEEVTWIDHHKTAKELFPKLWINEDLPGIRNLDKAAIELTWEWFYPYKTTPMAIKLIGDRDIWKFAYPETRAFSESANLTIKSPDDAIWYKLLEENSEHVVSNLLEKGEVLLEAKQKRARKSFYDGKDITFHGHKARLINTNHDVSDVGQFTYDLMNYPLALMYSDRGEETIVSLRSKTVDVSAIAKQYGGGGHKYAAGFSVPRKKFLEFKK